MPKDGTITRARLLDAACTLLAERSLSDLTIDSISERAGVTRRTFFGYFQSKDVLLAAAIEHARPIYLEQYHRWAGSRDPHERTSDRLLALIDGITLAVQDPQWKGCCFIRVSAELGNLKGHPVHRLVADANSEVEGWLRQELHRDGFVDASALAKLMIVLMNGLLVTQLITRSTAHGDVVKATLRKVLEESPRLTNSQSDAN